VVLVRHLYDLGELNRVSYSTMHEILREAAASMTAKKPAPVPQLAATMSGWSAEQFGPGESAMELRFLVGFSLKRTDDPFYTVPGDDAGSDAYFDARMDRYRDWTVAVAPLVKRCLGPDPDSVGIDFLYQDLFFGAREEAVQELAMLVTLAEVNHMLAVHHLDAGQARAVVAVLDGGENALLRTNVYDGATLAGSVDKAVDLSADLGEALDDMCDALLTLGLGTVETAADFTEDGQPEGAERFER
jgi:hypothetical protein